MAFAPIALTIPEYDRNLFKLHWLKAFEQGTTTPLAMATDATGGTTASRFQLDSEGFPITAGDARLIPFINGDYDLWLFPTAAEADANDTSNAIQFADNLNADPSQADASRYDERYGPLFATVAAMVAASPVSIDGFVVTLTAGMSVFTQGYTAAGDGGGAEYLVVAPTAAGPGDQTNANGTIGTIQVGQVANKAQFNGVAQDGADASHGIIYYVEDGDSVTVTVPTQFATLPLALKAVSGWIIDRAGTVVISIGTGKITETVNTVIDHPYGRRIAIQGAAVTDLSAPTAIVGVVDNGVGDHDVTYTYTDASSVSTGDYIGLRGLVGTGDVQVHAGVWKVTGKAGNDVTVKNTSRAATIAASAITTAVSSFKFNTVLEYTDSNGWIVRGELGDGSGVLAACKNIAVVGDGVGLRVGVFLDYAAKITTFTEFGIHGFGRHGIEALYNSTINGLNLMSSANTSNGIYVIDGSVGQVVLATTSGNGGVGVVSTVGSTVAFGSGVSSGNGSGMLSDGGSHITANNCLLRANTGDGALANENSSIDMLGSTSNANGSEGAKATQRSYINADNAIISSNTATDVLASRNSYISIDGATTGTESPRINARSADGSQVSDGTAPTADTIILTATKVHNFGSIPANSAVSTTITVEGVGGINDSCEVNYNAATVLGVTVTAHVTGVDTAEIIATNATTGALSLSNRSYRVTCIDFV